MLTIYNILPFRPTIYHYMPFHVKQEVINILFTCCAQGVDLDTVLVYKRGKTSPHPGPLPSIRWSGEGELFAFRLKFLRLWLAERMSDYCEYSSDISSPIGWERVRVRAI